MNKQFLASLEVPFFWFIFLGTQETEQRKYVKKSLKIDLGAKTTPLHHVIPAKAGIQIHLHIDPCLRRDDVGA